MFLAQHSMSLKQKNSGRKLFKDSGSGFHSKIYETSDSETSAQFKMFFALRKHCKSNTFWSNTFLEICTTAHVVATLFHALQSKKIQPKIFEAPRSYSRSKISELMTHWEPSKSFTGTFSVSRQKSTVF